jgi:hypothetical protein
MPLDPVTLRRTPVQTLGSADAPPSVERTLARTGSPLEGRLRADMEARFAYDFSRVKLHADTTAALSARDVSAHAYTVGPDIVFGAGQLEPGSEAGRRLIAHELAHVVQQSAASPLRGPGRVQRLTIGEEGDEYEREADRVAARVMRMSAPAMPAGGGTAPDPNGATNSDVLAPQDLTDGGTPLPDSLRTFFEGRFGRDLGEVRLHTGPRAAANNEQLGAYAFTYGSHIWLGDSQRAAPDYVLAHELAHVVQQRQPRSLQPHALAGVTGTTESRVQRVTVPFWVPLGRTGVMTGAELHKEILKIATKANTDLDKEANAPNADAKGVGPGHRGRIDVYRSTPLHVIPGMYFDGPEDTEDLQLLKVKNFQYVGRRGIANGRFRPYANDRRTGIAGMAEAPTAIELGELKPAAKPMLDSGATQLNRYILGMWNANRLTNKWAKENALAPWDLKSVEPMPNGAGPGHGAPRFTIAESVPRELVVADLRETKAQGAKYKITVHDAWVRGALHVRGRLHVIADSRPGIWMYYAKPENLERVVRNLRSRVIRGEITVANSVQDEVIDPLLRPPQHIAPLRKPGAAGVLQRKPKYDAPPAKFTDNFKLSTWLGNQRKLRNRIAHPNAALKQELSDLELFDGMYDAEKARLQVPQTGPSDIPPKKDELIDVVSKDPRRTNQRKSIHAVSATSSVG